MRSLNHCLTHTLSLRIRCKYASLLCVHVQGYRTPAVRSMELNRLYVRRKNSNEHEAARARDADTYAQKVRRQGMRREADNGSRTAARTAQSP